jgi:hypothetical protein
MLMSVQRSVTAAACMLVISAALGGASAQEKIGVAPCDEFLGKYETCIKTRVPVEHQPQFNLTITQLRSSLGPMAKAAPGQAEAVCRQIETVVKQRTAPMNCTW